MDSKKYFYVKISCPSGDDEGHFLSLFLGMNAKIVFDFTLRNIPNNLNIAKKDDVIFIQISGDSTNKKRYFSEYEEFKDYENGLHCVGLIDDIFTRDKMVRVKLIGLREVVTKEDLYIYPQFINNLGGSTKGTPNQAGLYELNIDEAYSLLDYLDEMKIFPRGFLDLKNSNYKGYLNKIGANLFKLDGSSSKIRDRFISSVINTNNNYVSKYVRSRLVIDKFVEWFNREENFKTSYSGIVNQENLEFWNQTYFRGNLFKIGNDKHQTLEQITTLVNDVNRHNDKWIEFNRSSSRGAPSAVIGSNNYLLFLEQFLNDYNYLEDESAFKITTFENSLKDSGLIYKRSIVHRFCSSIITKPFVILTGLSGSGKTKLAQAFVKWICQDENQYCLLPVGADWTNREPLLGYPNALKQDEYVKPDSGVLDLIIQANNNKDLPYFLILDEMNLSHVERYFADFLSVMESGEEIPLYTDSSVKNGVPSSLKIPSNLFIIGTVNIDETTNMFSPKVLDRANTIEFRVTKGEMENFLGSTIDLNMDYLTGKGAKMAKSFLVMSGNKSIITTNIEITTESLIQFFGELKKAGAEFGYRSATEILRLIHNLTVLHDSLTTNQKLDIAIMQKLLPKLHGSRRKLCPILETIGSFCISEHVNINKDVFDNTDFDFDNDTVRFPLSLEKISRMYRGAIDNGFASFAEA